MAANITLPRSSPESQGIRSTAVRHFIDAVEKNGLELHSFMLLRHGVVTAEGWWSPYQSHYPHMLFSLSKSFTSSAIGLAVNEGLLSVDDPVISFFPKDVPPEVSENLAEMRVRHLLSMSTGHAVDTTGKLHNDPSNNWVKQFLALPVENRPGAPFVYNSGATYMLSAIIQKVTGMKLLDYLRPRLFDPLGIEDPTWESCPMGINTGGWGLNIRTEDIARFGQMYLQKGTWNGARILPEVWVEEATKKQVPNGDNPESDWNQGYGYQFWRCRHNIYRGDGAFGQYCIVMPEQDAVLAITSGLDDMQAVLNLVWKHILPGMLPGKLKENLSSYMKLQEKLGCLVLRPPEGKENSPLASQVSDMIYHVEENPLKVSQICHHFDPKGGSVMIKDAAGEHQVDFEFAGWKKGTTTLFSREGEENLVMSNGTWQGADTFVLTLRYPLTPFYWTAVTKFSEDSIKVNLKENVSFGPTQLPELSGRW